MGLDQYLYRRNGMTPIGESGEGLEISDAEAEKFYAMKYEDRPEGWYHAPGVSVVAQWRKSNQIHAWFVDNVQDGVDECQFASVDLEQIASLLNLCKRALESRDASLLPCRSGFFFGGTEVDEWYWRDLGDTVDKLEPLVRNPPTPDDPYVLSYHSSW